MFDESLEELYEHAPSGYLSTTADGLIVRVNATFLGWTGFEREALLRRRRFQDLLSLPGRIYYETHLGPLLEMQGSLGGIAVDVVRADGSTLPAMISAARRAPAGDAPALTRFTVFNATERRRYEKELLQARRQAQAAAQAKASLLAMLSHDIRTPLGSIMAVTQLLERTALSPEQASYLRILRSSSSSMLTLLNEVLENSKIEAQSISLSLRSFDLGGLARELLDNLQPLARDKGIGLVHHLDERLPAAVLGDPTKLAQVLGNLMGNALKFTEAGAVTLEIAVTELTEAEVAVRVRVMDTGIGIEPEQVERIFQEYTQAHEGIAPRYGGSGLGLAISRKLLRAHGSELRVESRPGEGSVFWFELRLQRPT